MTIQGLLLGIVIVAIAHDAEVRRGLISEFVMKCAAYLLPKNERARYIEQWTADLRDTSGALFRLVVAFDLFRAGASVRAQLIEQELSVGARRVSTATDPQRGNIMNAVAVPVRSQSVALSDSASRMSARLSLGIVFAVFVTVGLLWVMNFLISITDDTPKPTPPTHWLEYVRVKSEPEPVVIKRKKPSKQEAPPETPLRGEFPGDNAGVKLAIPTLPPTAIPPDVRTGISIVSEGDLLEIVAVRPVYPPRAEARGLEGSCTVQYTVTRHGTVIDPVVLDNQCTHSLFRNASINAVLKFKYKPRVIDGVAVDVPGQTKKFTYVMDQ